MNENNKSREKEDKWVISSDDDKQTVQIKKILYENLALTKEIHRMARNINNFVIMSRIFSILKILIIIIPIILGIIYLPPLVKEIKPKINSLIKDYVELLGISREVKDNPKEDTIVDIGDIDVNQMSPELRELLKK